MISVSSIMHSVKAILYKLPSIILINIWKNNEYGSWLPSDKLLCDLEVLEMIVLRSWRPEDSLEIWVRIVKKSFILTTFPEELWMFDWYTR
jgi:hypothetical protein